MKPTLYIIMRTDIQDMNPGKAIAQACHAQADFDVAIAATKDGNTPELVLEWNAWKGDNSFGRTIVLTAELNVIKDIIANTEMSGTTVDSTYPWKNWDGEHFVSKAATCGWLFVSDVSSNDITFVKDLPLHK